MKTHLLDEAIDEAIYDFVTHFTSGVYVGMTCVWFPLNAENKSNQ